MAPVDFDRKGKGLIESAGHPDLRSERGQLSIHRSSLSPLKTSDCSRQCQSEGCDVCRNQYRSKSQREAHHVGLNFKGKAHITVLAANSDLSGFDGSEGECYTTDTTDFISSHGSSDSGSSEDNKVLTTELERSDLNTIKAVDSCSYPNWKGLMPDILSEIIKSLPLADNIHFGAVCSNWYSVVAQSCHPSAPQPPFLLLPGDSTGISEFFQFFDLTYKKFYKIRLPQLRNRRCIGSSQGNLIYMDDRCELHVFNPITGFEFDLPSITTFKSVGDPEFDEDGNVVGYLYYNVPRDCLPHVFPIDFFINNFHGKVIICPKTSVVIAISMRKVKIVVCLPGDKSWTVIDIMDPIEMLPLNAFEDILFYKDVLYAIGDLGELVSLKFGVDLSAIKYELLGQSCGYRSGCNLYRYLVEADGQLLLVWRCRKSVDATDADLVYAGHPSAEEGYRSTCVTFGFQVFRMNWGSMQWEEMKSLGEYALFLGFNSSFSLSSRDFPELKASSIYFTDDDDVSLGLTPRFKRDMGVFHLEDGTIEPCYPCDGDLRLSWPPPIWFTPKGLPPRYLDVSQHVT